MTRKALLELYRRRIDGELDLAGARELEAVLACDPRAAAELAELAELTRELPALPKPVHEDAFSEKIMRALPAEVPERRSVWAWLLRPRTLHVSPALALAALVVLGGGTAAILALTRHSAPAPRAAAPAATQTPAVPSENPSTVQIRFVLAAPGARSVELVGDFNDWKQGELELSSSGDGVWSLTMPLSPGRYAYQFVIDGAKWQPDPNAEATVADGFGGVNSLLRI
jgi:hypothetical protein